jgi:hypothetical protein
VPRWMHGLAGNAPSFRPPSVGAEGAGIYKADLDRGDCCIIVALRFGAVVYALGTRRTHNRVLGPASVLSEKYLV